MRHLRWAAAPPLVLGATLVLVGLAWTEWPQLLSGGLLVTLAAGLWHLSGRRGQAAGTSR